MLCEEPVCPGTLQDNLPGRTRTFIEKHTVTYTSFCLQTNQICIILSTEVLPYPRTSPRTPPLPESYLERINALVNCPGKYPLGHVAGKKSTPTTVDCKIANRKISVTKLSHHNGCTIRNNLTITSIIYQIRQKDDNKE